MNERFAAPIDPPYYAVIFSSQRNDGGDDAYGRMAENMMEQAQAQPGCLGAEAARDDDGFGITVSYWKDEKSMRQWKAHAHHLTAQRMGKEEWYAHYRLRVARIERAYSGPEGR